jgi:Flp pilus assembly protein TadD
MSRGGGFLQVRMGKLKEAEAELQEAIRLDPNEISYKESLQQLRDKMKQ